MAEGDLAGCTTEYGVQAANSKTILTVTLDLVEAERTLDMIGEGVCSSGQSASRARTRQLTPAV